MLLSPIKRLSVSALLAVSHANPFSDNRERVTIGYRVCSEAEARATIAAGHPTYGWWNNKPHHVLSVGWGTYSALNPDDWKALYNEWFCVVQADKEEWDKAPKAKIPEFDGKK
ncbi:Uu.00g127450.m01.CDS01 [Anthostomella pinea]|uniref:Uu.00g127450.m01.CDS01 n=1 Tax=Anthostomella pinea TaxID=933095 RepID=A0AAI8VIU8_9PEZI|nr:Uu.00g127450.m01.CDS01 [Anthostomella pinea]